ncbi:MAG TPA: response regulator [Gemmataceae bacterium]|nr:response regulator [Gemmataceae bacterium]
MAKPPIEKQPDLSHNTPVANGDEQIGEERLECVSRIHLLVVDDDAPTCQVIQAALEEKDFHIRAISNVAKVEHALKGATKFHIIILDYVLPGLNTKHVLNWVREHQEDAALIMITGYPSLEGALSGLRARAYEYLTKPFQIADLRATVVRCLQSKGLMRMSGNTLRRAVGATMRKRRTALKMTLEKLSKQTGMSLGYLSQIELGRVAPSIETLYKISVTLGISLSDFFEDLEPPA